MRNGCDDEGVVLECPDSERTCPAGTGSIRESFDSVTKREV